ncbi:PLU-1-domain-containing protein, partial [Metschnikowia bicuspidata var. bicuspidata NRRL YB-4993]
MARDSGAAFPSSARFVPPGPGAAAAPSAETPGASSPRPPPSAGTATNTAPRPPGAAPPPAKAIHVASANSSAAYLPIAAPAARTKRETADEVFAKLQRFGAAPRAHGPGGAQIPSFELGALAHKDPVLLAEALAAQGRRHGAVKIRMPAAALAERAGRLGPDAVTFRANRLVNNAPENELQPRLRFYHELLQLHTAGSRDAGGQDSGRARLPAVLAKLPMMDKRPLDLFDFFRLVLRKGGYAAVIQRKLWAQVGRELGYKGKITSSLSSLLKLSYAKLLYPLEVRLKTAALDLTGDGAGGHGLDATATADSGTATSSTADFSPDITSTADSGTAASGTATATSADSGTHTTSPQHLAHPVEPAKRRKLNSRAPLVLGLAAEFRRSVRLKAAKGYLVNEPHLVDVKTPLVISARDAALPKPDVLVSPIGAPAQINNYLKWLACFLPVMQDASRLELSSKMATTYSLRQFIERDALFQDFLLRKYGPALAGPPGAAKPGAKPLVLPCALEAVFWQYLADSPPEFRRLENCPKLPGHLAEGGVNYMGADFASHKAQVYAGSNVLAACGSAADAPSDTYDKSVSLQGLSRDYFAHTSRAMASTLSPFETANIPFLPDSLLGALSALDLASSDLVNPSLNIGMTFSTENWRCEDHFTQLSSFHFFGKSKRWYFIPELEFDKFELLLAETVASQNKENPRVNKNYSTSCWNVDSLSELVTADDDATNTQYEFLYNSLENIVSPYPETRMPHHDPVFERLIALKRKTLFLNQEYLITPDMLEERGIRYTTTLQQPGELIYKYPKTYSATISLGFNVSEEINFASKLWLDYSLEGEKWLQKQGILPSMLTFKLLINFAQILESANGNNHHFSPGVHSKVLEKFAEMLDTELALRNSVRQAVKIKEVTIEERNMPEADVVTDDDFLSAVPSKIVIHSKGSSLSFAISLATFTEYLADEGSLRISENLTFAELLKHPKYQFELQIFYSDERLRSLHRSLKGFSVDFESWMAKYDEMMDSEDDMVLKNYKALLHDGQKIYSALSGAGNAFETFCLGKSTNPEIQTQIKRIEVFKKQIENLRDFVEESSAFVEQCQAILSLKHQQRIRNGETESVDPCEDENPESLQLLVELTNKIPYLNFHAPEFELILEYKNEIQNFDKACRSLIELGSAAISEMNDMINLGTSFGIQIPSLKFLIRLKRRLQWIDTHKVIISGGDPFSGKKDIFSLPDLERFRDLGMKVLSSKEVHNLKMIDQYLKDGREYDDSIKTYLSQNKRLNDVDIAVLESKLVEMEEKSKWNGKDRLFVELSTYQKLVELKAEEKYVIFLREFSFKIHSLYDTRQTLLELVNCPFDYDDSHVKVKVDQCEEWLKKAGKLFAPIKILQRHARAHTALKNVCNAALAEKIKLLSEKTQTALSDENTDVFKNSSPYLYVYDIQDDLEEQGPIRYCLCRDYEEGTMIECDVCHEWFHVTCVKRISEIGNEDDRYICPCCLLLALYQTTSKQSEFPDKLDELIIFALLKEGEALQVQPMTELNLLRELWAVVEEARDLLSRPATRVKIVNHGSLYLIFLLRKFIGSPIVMNSIIEHLMNLLR